MAERAWRVWWGRDWGRGAGAKAAVVVRRVERSISFMVTVSVLVCGGDEERKIAEAAVVPAAVASCEFDDRGK